MLSYLITHFADNHYIISLSSIDWVKKIKSERAVLLKVAFKCTITRIHLCFFFFDPSLCVCPVVQHQACLDFEDQIPSVVF